MLLPLHVDPHLCITRAQPSALHRTGMKLLCPKWNEARLPFSPAVIIRAKSLQLCLGLCDPMDCGPTKFLCPWDFPARILEWVTVPSSRGSS